MSQNDESITFRVSKLYKKKLLEHCENMNLSISKVMTLLLEKELFGKEKVVTDRFDEILDKLNQIESKLPGAEKVRVPVTVTEPKIIERPPVKKVGVVKKSVGGKRFNTKPWEVDGKLPCPVCKVHWESASNIDRHYKKHSTSRREIFSNPEYIKIADELVAAKKGV